MSHPSESRIFISYARADSEFVNQLRADLLSRNMDAWVDTSRLEGGQNWAQHIQQAIDERQIMLVVLSPDSVASEWVQKEYIYAQARYKRIIPLLYRPVAIPVALVNVQYIDFQNYDRGIKEVLKALTPIQVNTPAQEHPLTSENATLPDELYRLGMVARAHGDLDRAAVYWQQLVDADPYYGNGSVRNQLDEVNRLLLPIRLQRLRQQASDAKKDNHPDHYIGAYETMMRLIPDDAEPREALINYYRQAAMAAFTSGNWQEAIAAWHALARLDTNNTMIGEYVPIAQQNQQTKWRYDNIRTFVNNDNVSAARAEFSMLWQEAPYYGDPDGLAAELHITVPPDYDTAKRLTNVQRRELINTVRRSTSVEVWLLLSLFLPLFAEILISANIFPVSYDHGISFFEQYDITNFTNFAVPFSIPLVILLSASLLLLISTQKMRKNAYSTLVTASANHELIERTSDMARLLTLLHFFSGLLPLVTIGLISIDLSLMLSSGGYVILTEALDNRFIMMITLLIIAMIISLLIVILSIVSYRQLNGRFINSNTHVSSDNIQKFTKDLFRKRVL